MRYWWASQGDNFQHVAHRGGLWTCPSATGHSRPDRELIKDLSPGDLVFHYGRGYLRAISEVTEAWKPFMRPRFYSPRDGEGNDGWLVPTAPVVTELTIHFQELAEVVGHGSPGPLDINGRPMQRFLSRLTSRDAAGLIRMVEDRLGQNADHEETAEGAVWTGGEHICPT